MKLWIKVFITFVVLPIAAIGFFYFLDQRGFFNLSQIQIIVEDSSQFKFALKKPVEKLDQRLEQLRGQSLLSLKLRTIIEELDQETWIESFHLSRHWPSTLQLVVKPEKIFFNVINSKGEMTPVLENGFFLEPIKAGEAPDLPIATASVFEKSHQTRLKLIEILKQIPDQGTFSRRTISEIHFDARNGFSFSLVNSGLRVKMGEEKIRTKSLRVSKVLDYLDSKKFQARVIDANLSQKVLVRLRKDP